MVRRFELGATLENMWHTAYVQNPLHVPFYTFSWHHNWFSTLGKKYQPLILESQGIIAPFAQKGGELTFSGGDESSDYLDIIGPDSQKENSWREIISYLSQEKIYMLKLRNIPENSPTVSFFENSKRESAFLRNTEVIKEDTTPRLILPDSWEEYVSSLPRKPRQEIRRKLRKFERDFPQVKLTWETNSEENIMHLLSLMRLNPEKSAFLSQDMELYFKSQLASFANDLWFLILKKDSTRVASLVAFKTDDTLLLYNTGFDERAYSGAGFYLHAQSIKLAIENGFKHYNFLQGRERYKYELGGKDFYVYTVKANRTL